MNSMPNVKDNVTARRTRRAAGRVRRLPDVPVGARRAGGEVTDVQERPVWDIRSTTELLREVSASAGPDEVFRLFVEHVRGGIQVRRALLLSNRGLEAPHYRVVRRLDWSEDARGAAASEGGDARAGGLLARILYLGEFQNVADLAPDPADPDHDLLRGSRSLLAFPVYEGGAGTGMVVMLGPSPGSACDDSDLCGLAMMTALLDRATAAQALAGRLDATVRALDAELRAAADVQRWLLPPSLPEVAGAGVAASYRTARHSGGDYYDVGTLPDGRLGVLVADVSGKGAAAAVIMAVLRTVVHETEGWPATATAPGPAALLDHVDRRLCALGLPRRGVFVTAVAGALDARTGAFTYSCAGHPPPRLLRAADGAVVPLDGAGALPLAIVDEPVERAEETVTLMPGDVALFYTDGITEARSPDDAFFGEALLDETLRALPAPATPHAAVQAVARAVAGHEGASAAPADDQTLLAMGRDARAPCGPTGHGARSNPPAAAGGDA